MFFFNCLLGVPIHVISFVIVGFTLEIPKSATLQTHFLFTNKFWGLISRWISFN